MKRIQLTGDLPEGHRGDFKTCPHCGYTLTTEEWDKSAHTLIPRPERYRKGCAAIISECGACFESSWLHINLYSVIDNLDESFPENWVEAAKKEEATRKLQALRDWGAALCWKCSLLISATTGYRAYRRCEKGEGPAEKVCDQFVNMIGEN
jgi:hypothetical protein